MHGTFEFVIPVCRDDLLNRTAVSQYVVDEVLSPREISGALHELKVSFRSKGTQAILHHFEVLFSILCIQKDLDQDLKEEAWQLLLNIGKALSNDLGAVLDEGCMETEERKCNLNKIKMVCYLLTQYIELFETEDTQPSATQLVTAKGRGRAKKKKTDDSIDWDSEREVGVKTLLHIVSMNLQRLWDPPIAEEEFVNLVGNSCYKLLENPSITRMTSRETREAINNIIGSLVKRYNHGLSCSLKVLQLLQHFEHLVTPMVQMVQTVTEDFHVKSVVCEIIREVGRMDPSDVSRDASGTRCIATFLVELAEKIPATMLPNISLLVSHLDEESYVMRNAVLGVMGEIVLKILSKDDLDDKLKTTRDQFLDNLEEHVHDVHAFVRSKVLQIWLNIVNEKCLPLPRQEALASLVIGRLEDKSSQVRKHAIQLVTALFKSNPFAAKLTVEDLNVTYNTEKEKLKQMMEEEAEKSQLETSTLEEEWESIEGHLKTAIEEEEELEEVVISDEETVQSITEKIIEALKEEQWQAAVCLTAAAIKSFPELGQPSSPRSDSHGTDSQHADSQGSENSDSSPSEVSTEISLIHSVKAIFMDHKGHSLVLAAEAAHSQPSQEEGGAVSEFSKQQVLVQYLKDTLAFATQIQKAVPCLCQMLGSKTLTDVLEAIEFFVTGFEFGLSASMIGVRRMLPLIWSKEGGIKDAVVTAYKRLYINTQSGGQRARALAVVKNLSALASGATLGDIKSLEGLIVELMKNGDMDRSVTQMLWERFTLKVPDTTPEDSRNAVLLLSMAARAENSLIKQNIDVLVSEGLGPRAESDFVLAKNTCMALMSLAVNKKAKGAVASKPNRLVQTHAMFTRLQHILVTGIGDVSSQYWIPLAEQAIKLIYHLSDHPDIVCADVVKKLAGEVMRLNNHTQAGKSSEDQTKPGNGSEDQKQAENSSPEQKESGNGSQEEKASDERLESSQGKTTCSAAILSRFLTVVGQVALCQLVYLDTDILGELKRRHALQEEKTKKTPAKKNGNKSMSGHPSESIEEELGLAGAAAEDAEAEYMRKICEQEIVTGSTLLGTLGPLLVAVCTNQTKFSDLDLQTAANLALAKFMLVSSEFCDKHLQLLFTVLEKSSNPTIRANTIVALGDLTVRFPNLIEPWTPHMYARLRDDSPLVRKNTLQILTHLILNDMVKVKGQISEMATCIVDKDERISNLAKLFFLELSRKGNAVYNIMPDIVSRLSDPEVGVEEDNFRIIMRYLFSFIQKEKQCESLVEKMCHRFRATRTERQWRDLAFCLSLLSYNEKSLRKLQENFVCFADKMADEEVYSCFVNIINKSRSFSKPETKTLIDEIEERLTACHTKGMEDEDLINKASKAKSKRRTSGRPAKTPAGRRKASRRRGKDYQSDDDDDDDDFCNENKTPAPSRKSQRAAKPKPKLSFNSDEESDIELFDVDKSSQNTSVGTQEDESEESEAELIPVRRKNKNHRPLQSVTSPS